MIELKARNCNTRVACVPLEAAQRAHGNLTRFCAVLGSVYNVHLPGFTAANQDCPCALVKSLKKFCGGLIEGEKHEWRPIVRRLNRRTRCSIAASLFLFRKVLPSPGVDLDSYMDKMSTPSPEPDPEFVRFCEDRVVKIFRAGWDRNYTRLPERVILTRSSCVERGMGKGGQRALVASGDSWLNRQSFCEYVLHSSRSLSLGSSRVVSVETGGKNRIVSTPSVSMNVLRPLHQSMYDHLSRQSWLLRGDATPARFEGFSRVSGEIFTSGDYESATDNLNAHIQKLLLRKVCEQAANVPLGVRDTALRSLQMSLTNKSGRVVVQTRGQLMGNLLSFPLLCLVNYLAFKFFVRRPVPVLINGDDIVFRSSRQESKRWSEGVGRSGLVLSKGKTLFDSRFFSLNSRFFDAGKRVRLVPVIRAKSYFGAVEEGVLSLKDRWKSCCEGFGGEKREIVREGFLRENRRYILPSYRSVRNGLGMGVSQRCLERAGLYWRELSYMQPRLPIRSPSGEIIDWIVRYQDEVPLSEALKVKNPYNLEGWTLKRIPYDKQASAWQKEHARAVIDRSWVEPFIGDMGVDDKSRREEIRRRVRDSGIDVSSWILSFKARLSKFSKLAQCSRNAARKFVSPYIRLPEPCKRPKVRLLFCPDGFVPTDTSIQFCQSSEQRTAL